MFISSLFSFTLSKSMERSLLSASVTNKTRHKTEYFNPNI